MNHNWMSRQLEHPKISLHKNSFPKLKEKFQPEVIDTSQIAMQSLVFSNYPVCVRRKGTSNRRFETLFSIELSVLTGGNVMLKMRSKNRNYLTQNIGRKTKRVFFEKSIENVILKENENEKGESYLYSTEKNQCYDLIWAILTKRLSIACIDGH